jgi:hypothetical protein
MAVASADRYSIGRSSSSRVSEAAWSVVVPLALVRGRALLLPDYEAFGGATPAHDGAPLDPYYALDP